MNADPWILARSSLKYFTVKFLGLRWPAHYTEWETLVENNPRALIESPRGSWKSYFFSLAYPLWKMLRQKTEILLVSDSETQARTKLRLMREMVETQPQLAPMRPSTKELWGTDQIQFANGSICHIMGFGTSRRGIHPGIIIPDDIESESNAMSRDARDRMYFAVISGMATPETRIAAVGTPLEFGDILQQLSKNETYKWWRRPATQGGVNQYKDIWEDSWLAFKKREMGSINFAREMLLERIDPETQPFKRDYETLYDVPPPRERFMFVGTICDPAYSEGDGDFTAIVTGGITHGNHAYALAVDRIRRDDPGVIVDKLFSHIAAWNPDSVGIKRRKGDAISFTFNERRIRENRWGFRYVEIMDTKSKTDVSRIGGLVPRWEARSIHIHRNMKDFLEEWYQFRLDDSHAYDDQLDAFADLFHPEMARPNGGRRHAPSDIQKYGRPLLQVGRSYQRVNTQEWKNFDRRIYDGVAA